MIKLVHLASHFGKIIIQIKFLRLIKLWFPQRFCKIYQTESIYDADISGLMYVVFCLLSCRISLQLCYLALIPQFSCRKPYESQQYFNRSFFHHFELIFIHLFLIYWKLVCLYFPVETHTIKHPRYIMEELWLEPERK